MKEFWNVLIDNRSKLWRIVVNAPLRCSNTRTALTDCTCKEGQWLKAKVSHPSFLKTGRFGTLRFMDVSRPSMASKIQKCSFQNLESMQSAAV